MATIATLRRRRTASPIIVVVSEVQPDPEETVWTLGVGGVVVSPLVGSGFALTLATTLLNDGVAVAFTPADVLDALAWRGGDEAALFAPAVAWISAPAGTLTLTIAAGQSSALDPGEYRIQVGVTRASGVRSLCYDGRLTVLATIGAAAPALTWCSAADVLRYATSVSTLQAIKAANDSSGFLLQRADATARRSRMLVKRYNPRPGFVKVRNNLPDPIAGLDIQSPTAVWPSKRDVAAALATVGGIVLEQQLREMIARDAISLILRRQATGASASVYLAEAEAMEAMADAIYREYQPQLVTAAPIGVGVPVLVDGSSVTTGFTNFLIDMDCTILPMGTAA